MKILNQLFNFSQKGVENTQKNLTGADVLKAQESDETKDVNTQLETFGVDPKSELGQAMTMAAQKGVPIEAKTIDDMKSFLNNVDGTTEEKLETVKTALDKGVGTSSKVLTLLHTALHESAIPEEIRNQLIEMMREGMPKSQMREILMAVAKALPSHTTVSKDQLGAVVQLLTQGLTNQEIELEDLSQTQLMTLVKALVNSGSETVDVNSLIDAFEPKSDSAGTESQESAIIQPQAHIRTELFTHKKTESQFIEQETSLGSVTVEPNTADLNVEEDVLEFLDKLDQKLETLVERVRNDSTSSDLDKDLSIEMMDGPEMDVSVMEAADDIMALLQDNSNTFIVREVTQKMAQITEEFRDVKRQVVQTLSDVSRSLETSPNMSKTEKLEQLGKVIDQVDKVLLKSDMTLYTDMKTEKQLLTFSSNLQEARNLLQQGNHSEAKVIVDEVMKAVDSMTFKPTKVKVMHVVNQKALDQVNQLQKNSTGIEMMNKHLSDFENMPKSGRGVLDYVRQLGLNHDSELVERMGLQKEMKMEDQKVDNNMRHILQKLSEDVEDRTRMVQASDKMMNHLTGQQLANKLETKSQGQNLFFNIPLKMQEEIKDLKLYVKSRKQDQKIDWENASLYFAFETKHYDEMGIRVVSVNKNVNISVLNDHDELKNALKPLMSDFKGVIEEAGYYVGGIHYGRLTVNPKDAKIEEASETLTKTGGVSKQSDDYEKPIQKGFDVKI